LRQKYCLPPRHQESTTSDGNLASPCARPFWLMQTPTNYGVTSAAVKHPMMLKPGCSRCRFCHRIALDGQSLQQHCNVWAPDKFVIWGATLQQPTCPERAVYHRKRVCTLSKGQDHDQLCQPKHLRRHSRLYIALRPLHRRTTGSP